MKNRFLRYINDVLSGKVKTGELTMLAIERCVKDMGKDWEFELDWSIVEKVCNFFELLHHWKGQWANQPIRLEDHQIFYLGNLFGWVNKETGLRRFRTSFKEVARKNAKALSIHTLIPTTLGFKPMGEIQEGDIVFDENGLPCFVDLVTEIMYGHECYTVYFNDGSKITCDADHLWTVTRRISHRGYYEVTEDTKTLSKNIFDKDGELVNRIKVAGPLMNASKNLPITPYVLGAWLGDGVTESGNIVCSDLDCDIIKAIENRGYIVNKKIHKDKIPVYRIGVSAQGPHYKKIKGRSLQRELRINNLLNNKHIPKVYFNASINQRTELLWGLMDTDGTISKAGQCGYTSVKYKLILDVERLIKSLGFKCNLTKQKCRLNGKIFISYRILFFAYNNRPVFLLQRKRSRQKEKPKNPTRNYWRHITKIIPCDSVPVKCIKVQSDNHLYLAGEDLIPTHNTTECACKAIYHLMADGEQGAQVYSAATKEDQARLVVNDAGQIIKKTKFLVNKFKLYRSREKITRVLYPATNSYIHPLGSDSDSQDGFDPSYGIIDEYHAHPTDAMLNVIESGMGARRQPLIDIITTAGFNKDHPCYSNLRKVAIEVLKGIKVDESLFALIYELDADDDWADEKNWIKSNPNLGVSVSLDHLRARAIQAKNEGGTKEVDFKTKNLNIWTDASDVFIQDEKWMECNFGKFEPTKGMQCFGGLDLAYVRDMTALVFVFVAGKVQLVPFFFVNEEMVKLRRADGIRYDLWAEQGYITVTPGNATDYNFIKKKIQDFCLLYDVKKINYDRYNSSQLVIDLLELGIPMEGFGQGYISMHAPTQELEKLVWMHEINHQGNPVLRWMLSNVELKKDPAGNVKVDKGKSSDKVDGIVASIMAIAAKIGDGKIEEPFVYDKKDILIL